VALESSHHEVHAIRQAIAIAANHYERSVRGERLQVPLDSGVLVARNLKHAEELTSRRRMMNLLADLAKQLVAGEHREF
jgi:hypothetical protein